jgi:S-DNA-T family DNA segregation ATPase FtsK/SpoIIIE
VSALLRSWAWWLTKGVGRSLLAFGHTAAYVVIVVASLMQARTSVAALLLAVVLLAAGVAAVIWFPRFAPGLGDWRRWRKARATRRAALQGYRHAVGMRLIPALSDDDYEWAMRRPVKRLPSARFRVMPDWVVLTVAQTQAATTDELVKRAEAYAPVVGAPAEWVTVQRQTDAVVRIVWRRAAPVDQLAESIPFQVAPAPGDPIASVLVGRTDAGAEYRLNVFDRMTCVLGSSGAGKGSYLWSTVLALVPHVKAGSVEVWAADLKGGVEISAGLPMFARVATTFEEAAEMIAALRVEVDRRLEYMVSVGSRKHIPTPEEPARLMIFDEYASLVYSAPSSKEKAAVEADLKSILSRGRAARINVLAFAQDPRADSLLARPLFTNVVGLRFRTADDTKLAIGPAAYDAGATCELIPQSTPGVGYALDEESGTVQRVRAFWVSDEVLARTSEAMTAWRAEVTA